MTVKIKTEAHPRQYSKGPIYFPSWVTPPTQCTQFTNTKVTFTNHGIVKEEIQGDGWNLLALSESKEK